MSGTPAYYSLGAKDSSNAAEMVIGRQLGQVVLNCFSFSAKGPEKSVGSISELTSLLGENTFDEMSKYYFHPIRFMKRFGAPGSSIVFNRVLPDDMNNEANVQVYIDIVEDDIPNYVRDSQGYYVVDPDTNGYKVDPNTPTISGYKIKFIKEHIAAVGSAPQLGMLTPKSGTMTSSTGEVSKMYPFIQANAKWKGSEYNLLGFGFNSYTDEEIDPTVVNATNAMLYGLTLYKRPNDKSTPAIFRSLFNENSVGCTLKAKQVDPNTSRKIGLEEVFNANWFNEDSKNGTIRYWDYEGMYLYRDNLELILNLIKAKEVNHISQTPAEWDDGLTAPSFDWFDFTNEALENDEYIFNLFTCKSTKNIPYFSVIISDEAANTTGTQKEINISNNTPIMLDGASDGTMTNEELNRKVGIALEEYSDNNSPLQDPVLSPETLFVDSGFDLEIKKKAFNMVTLRKDTALLLTTYDYDRAKDGHEMPISDELAVLKALSARAQMAPESIYFGTECARAAIVMGAGQLGDGSKEYIPNTLEIMGYMTDMMGAANGKWKEVEIFDDRCYARELVNTVPKFIPNGMKPVLWKAGAIFPTPTDRGAPKFIGLQTVYPDATSVMNNIFTMVALCTCERIARNSWLELSGNSRDTAPVFLDKVETHLNSKHEGIFAGMFKSIPRAYLTKMDEINGNSWRVVTELYGNVAKTECTHSTDVYRRGDE